MSLEFGLPDDPKTAEAPEVSAQKEPKTASNAPTGGASADAFDLTAYITQSREKASTGERVNLEPDEFTDEDLLSEAGYNEDGEFEGIEEVESEEVPNEPIEISEEWLDIFAMAGVELTDEAVPQVLKWMHAEDDHTRFKLPPTRRDRLQIAWKIFLRKVLPAWDDKEGLLAVIVLLYIENIITGVWKMFGRVMSGTFTWPDFWPFNRFNKKKESKEAAPEPAPAPATPPPPVSRDISSLEEETVQPAPSIVREETLNFELPKRAEAPPQKALPPAPEPPKDVHAPKPIEAPGNKLQDATNHKLFERGKGYPRKDKMIKSKKNGRVYHMPKDSFCNNSSMLKWMHASGMYKTNEEIEQ